MHRSKFLNNVKIHESWMPLFSDALIQDIINIENKIGNDYTPVDNKVMRFASTNLNSTKVIILGQDPYPQVGAATGRAFEVNGLESWTTTFKQSSLRNILKLLYKTYNNDLITYSQLKDEIRYGTFEILPPSKLFQHWENEGVLLLNTYLTCEPGAPQSHRVHWKNIALKLLEYLNLNCKDAVWFLWGGEAQRITKNIDISNIIACDHPMLCSPKKSNSFINSDCFHQTANMVDWLGINP